MAIFVWKGAFSVLLFKFCMNPDSWICYCCSASKSCPTLRPHGLQHASLPYPSLSPRICSNACSLCWWCYPTISSFVTPFSSCPQSFPASGSCLFQWICSLHQVNKVLELQLQHQSFQWIFRVDYIEDWFVWSSFSPKALKIYE